MTNEISEPLFIQIGRRRYQVSDLQQASEMFCAARDKSGVGNSKLKSPDIVTADGRVVARLSYNGRVWPAAEWFVGQEPLYDNRITEAP